LGRRILEKQPTLKIFGETYRLKAEVAKINGLSAHADRSELLSWVAHFHRRPNHIFIVHGEEEASFALAQSLDHEQGFQDVYVPELGQSFTV
jgi:metallo-beta-lactamase family protein